jgi:hypothetical protein
MQQPRCIACDHLLTDFSTLVPPSPIEISSARLVEGLLGWAFALRASADFKSVCLANIRTAGTALGGQEALSRAIGGCVSPWFHGRVPSFASLLRLSLMFGIATEVWFSSLLPPDRFSKLTAVPAVPWLSFFPPRVGLPRSKTVFRDATCEEAALRKALTSPAKPPPSIQSVAQSLSIRPSRLSERFPKLAARLVARRHAYTMRLVKMAQVAVAELSRSGSPTTYTAVLVHLGHRWPLSPLRLRYVLWELRRSVPIHPAALGS